MAHTTSAAMIRTVALLALIASVSALWPFHSNWNSGLAQTFMKGTKLPRNVANATKEGWVEVQGPATSTGYHDLTLLVKPSEPTTGLFFDGDNVAGVLVATPVDDIKPYYNLTEQGLTPWTYSINGETKTYLTSRILFVTEDKLTRTYDSAELIQADHLAFESLDGKIDYLPKNLKVIKEDSTSVWIQQRCLPLMGSHYYHSMTTSTTCDKPFVPYFGLYDEHTFQLIGVGYMTMGACVGDAYEHPDETAVRLIVNNGPECLYEMTKKYGVCTRHIYFVDNPNLISCL